MAAYLIAKVEIDDPEIYSNYTAKSPAIVEKYGGKFLSRGGDLTVLEGDDFNGRLVIVEFPNKDSACNFYRSEEYQAARLIREPISNAQFIVIDGIEHSVE